MHFLVTPFVLSLKKYTGRTEVHNKPRDNPLSREVSLPSYKIPTQYKGS